MSHNFLSSFPSFFLYTYRLKIIKRLILSAQSSSWQGKKLLERKRKKGRKRFFARLKLFDLFAFTQAFDLADSTSFKIFIVCIFTCSNRFSVKTNPNLILIQSRSDWRQFCAVVWPLQSAVFYLNKKTRILITVWE